MGNSGSMKFSVVLEAITSAFNSAVKQAQSNYTNATSSIRKDSGDMSNATQAVALDLKKIFQASDARGITDALKATTAELRGMSNGATLSATQLKQVGIAGKTAMSELRSELTRARAELSALSAAKASPKDLDTARQKVAQLVRDVGDASAAYQRFQAAASSAMNKVATAEQEASNQAKSAGKAIYDALNIRSGGTVRQEIAAITRELQTFRTNAGAPAAELARVSQAAQAKLAELRNELRGVSSAAPSVASSLKSIGGAALAFAGVTAGLMAIKEGLTAIIGTTVKFQSVSKQLEYATGSAQKAGEAFAFVKKTSYELGLDLLSSAQGFSKLAAATKGTALEGQATQEIFLGVSRAVATMSLSTDEANGVFLALSQIAGKGKVSMEELRGQLGERLPPAMKIAADSMGVSVTQLNQLVESGLDAEEFLAAFGPALAKAFSNDATKNLDTLNGQLAITKNKFNELLNDLGNSGVAGGTISVLKDMNEMIAKVGTAIKSIDPKTLDAVKTAFDNVYRVVKEVFSALFSAVADVAGALDTLLGGVSAVLGGFLGLGAANDTVSFLTRAVQGLSVVIGTVADGVTAIRIAFTAATGVVESFFAAVALGLSKVTFGDLSKELEQFALQLSNSAQEHFKKANDAALSFQSAAVAAMDRAVQASEQGAQKSAEAQEQGAARSAAAQESVATAAEGAARRAGEALTYIGGKAQESAQHVTNLGNTAVQAGHKIVQSMTGGVPTFTQVGVAAQGAAKNVGDIGVQAEQTKQKIAVFAGAGGGVVLQLTNITNEASEAFKNLAKAAGATTFVPAAQSANEYGLALATVVTHSKQAADVIAKELPEAVSKLNAVDLSKFQQAFIGGLKEAGASADYVKARIADLAAAAAKSLGVDLAESLNGLSAKFRDNETALKSLSDNFESLKQAGISASKLLADGLQAMLDKAKNPTEIQELIRLWRELGNQGKITGKELADGLQAVKDKLDELTPGINSVQEAFHTFGQKTREEAKALADNYGEAFKKMESSGQATTAQLQEAFKTYAEAAIAANGGVSTSFLDAKAAALGLQIQVDAAGHTTITTMEQAAQATDQLTQSMRNAGDAATQALAAENAAREQVIATQEKQLELIQREIDLANKKKGVDRDGFATDSNGDRIQQTIPTWLSAYNMLKGYGLPDQAARDLAGAHFNGSNGAPQGDPNQPYKDVSALIRDDAEAWLRSHKAGDEGGPSVMWSGPSGGVSSANIGSPSSGSSVSSTTIGTSNAGVASPTVSKVIKLQFISGGKTIDSTIDATDVNAFMEMLKNAKAISTS